MSATPPGNSVISNEFSIPRLLFLISTCLTVSLVPNNTFLPWNHPFVIMAAVVAVVQLLLKRSKIGPMVQTL